MTPSASRKASERQRRKERGEQVMSPLEKASRAVFDSTGPIHDTWETLPQKWRDIYTRHAKAAFKAVMYDVIESHDYETTSDRWKFNDRISEILGDPQ